MKIWILFLLVAHHANGQDYSQCGRTLLKETDEQGNPMPGGLAVAGEFPNMCTLYLLYEGFNVFTGGASLISSNQVLTLASGVSKYRGFQQESIGEDDLDLRGANKESCGDTTGVKFDLFVSCGGINLQPNEADPNKQTRKVKSILIHPEFNPKSLTNDMAVLVVDSPFEMTEFVGPACLPEPSFDPKNSFCVATGHGKDIHGEYGYYSKDLQRTSKLDIWTKEDCEATLNSEYFQKNHSLTWEADSSFICAGGTKDVDTCEGDGGGPLVCLSREIDIVFDYDKETDDNDGGEFDIFAYDQEENDLDLRDDTLGLRQSGVEEEPEKLIQIGIVAWGIECGQEGIPSVYSSLMAGRCWLDQVMSCYKDESIGEDDLDLRGSNRESPISVGGLTESQCGSWLQSRASDEAACGCKQKLAANKIQTDDDPGVLGLREETLGLRQANGN